MLKLPNIGLPDIQSLNVVSMKHLHAIEIDLPQGSSEAFFILCMCQTSNLNIDLQIVVKYSNSFDERQLTVWSVCLQWDML